MITIAALSDYLEAKVINWALRATAMGTAPATVYVGLFTAATTDAGGAKQRAFVISGQADLVTGRTTGGAVDANDVDGVTTALSPDIRLGSGAWRLTFNYTFAHDAAATNADFLRFSVVRGSTVTPIWTLSGQAANRNARWLTRKMDLTAWAGQSIQLLIEARDGGTDNIVEAAIDDLRVFKP